MTWYTVEWKIDLEAESAKDAATLAREIQLDPNNTENHFSVWNQDRAEWYEITTDLSPMEAKQ